MARVLIVPGLAVHGYAAGAAEALRAAGHDAELLDPPAWRGSPTDLAAYGGRLARRIDAEGRPVGLLVGLSVGTQAAAVAASGTRLVERLLLVSPTVDPGRRHWVRLVAIWLSGEGHENSPSLTTQVPDWRRAGVRRIVRGIGSALHVRVEEVLARVDAEFTVVHAEADRLSPLTFAARLAYARGGRLVVVPDAPHSWPTKDEARFVEFVDDLLGAR